MSWREDVVGDESPSLTSNLSIAISGTDVVTKSNVMRGLCVGPEKAIYWSTIL
jgi:hypothetical protein